MGTNVGMLLLVLHWATCTTFGAAFGPPSRARPLGPRSTPSGPVLGFEANDTKVWRGIPYASAPVGDLRLRPPQPPQPWTVPRDATEFGASCLQVGSPGVGAHFNMQPPIPAWESLQLKPSSEDCLFLNVCVRWLTPSTHPRTHTTTTHPVPLPASVTSPRIRTHTHTHTRAHTHTHADATAATRVHATSPGDAWARVLVA